MDVLQGFFAHFVVFEDRATFKIKHVPGMIKENNPLENSRFDWIV